MGFESFLHQNRLIRMLLVSGYAGDPLNLSLI